MKQNKKYVLALKSNGNALTEIVNSNLAKPIIFKSKIAAMVFKIVFKMNDFEVIKYDRKKHVNRTL